MSACHCISRHTQNNERLLGGVRLWLVARRARFVDAIADPSQAGEGGEVRQSPGPAQHAEPLLGLGGLCFGGDAADGLSEGNLLLDRARGPLRSAGDKRRALRGEGAAGGQLHVRDGHGEGSHVGSHCARAKLQRDCAQTVGDGARMAVGGRKVLRTRSACRLGWLAAPNQLFRMQ